MGRLAAGPLRWKPEARSQEPGARMDLRAFYRTIREIETGISEESVVIISRETPEGGRAGVRTDVPRGVAARLIAEDKAELAKPEAAAKVRAEGGARVKW